MVTVFEAAGGIDGLRRLAGAWHQRVMADPVVSHAFSHGFHPEHVERLAAYWAEALGGPSTYSDSIGSETAVVKRHSGNGKHEEMDQRAIECFDRALVDAGLDANPVLKQVLHDYFAWSTTTTMARYHQSSADVPSGLSIPRWSWDGPQESGPMLEFRETRLTDVESLFEVRARTRQNPLSRTALAHLGITPESTAFDLRCGKIVGFVCTSGGHVVGFCSGDVGSGEVLVLAVLPDYEGRGIGRQLLSNVVARLVGGGTQRVWLAAASDPIVRAHGFYRALGWRPTGASTSNGDEILELHPAA